MTLKSNKMVDTVQSSSQEITIVILVARLEHCHYHHHTIKINYKNKIGLDSRSDTNILFSGTRFWNAIGSVKLQQI